MAVSRTLAALVLAASLSACDATAQSSLVQDRIYPAPRAALSLDGAAAGASLINVQTQDGLTLTGLAVEGRADRPVLLVLHGNGFSAREALDWFGPSLQAGYGVVAAEYRGYSGNPGRPDEAGLAQDADAFLAYARQMAAGRPVWIVGHSLGGGVAMALAERSPPDVLITVGTFTRLRDMAPTLARGLVPDAYRNIDRAATVRAPWFAVHGLADTVVPASQGSTLHAIAGRNGRTGASFVIRGEDHWPNGSRMHQIVEAIRTRAEGSAPSPAAVSAEILIIPFGQSTPLAAP